jgi:dolichol-phosphate mannosyltransferase
MAAVATHVADDPQPARAPELTVVVPTFNESANVAELVRRLDACLRGRAWEVMFVDDDSPDGTAAAVRALANADSRVRVIQRIGRRGLSSACIEGMLASAAPYVAVMDADLQHDERLLPTMLDTLRDGAADVVIGSRYVSGGGVGQWDESRAAMSRFATRLGRMVLPAPVADPMSGFFMLRRDVLESRVRGVSGLGFKILLDLLTAERSRLRIVELPYQFRERFAGDSKLDSSVAWDFLMLVGDRLFGRYVPVRFVAFAAVGGTGVFVHLAILTVLLKATSTSFPWAQSAATAGAMVFNYAINNLLTFRDRRLKGWRWLWGLATFVLACSVGALANVGIASYLFERQDTQWLLAALAGIAVGAVWNYAVTNAYTWSARRRGG